MDWLHSLLERIHDFFTEKPDNEYQRMRKSIGLPEMSRIEGFLNFMIIIILSFFLFVAIGILGWLEII